MAAQTATVSRSTWQVTETNAEQQYLTHGIFRYFGKLPPTLTGRLLDVVGLNANQTVVDLMCGSGTTLVEAGSRGANSIGVDCNDLSVLISKVKTHRLSDSTIGAIQQAFDEKFAKAIKSDWPITAPAKNEIFVPKIVNLERWFETGTRIALSTIRSWCLGHTDAERDFLLVAFASIIRESSKASVRTGRLFYDKEKKPPNPYALFASRLSKLRQANARIQTKFREPAAILTSDARATGLPSNTADVVFCHPPYFSLYKYSSDILRFELAWLGFDRKPIAAREIEDGFKTMDASLSEAYVSDLIAVAQEAARISKPGAALVIVTADSTLRLQPLGIMQNLIRRMAAETQWRLTDHILRPVKYTQATYHKSANAEIKRADDEILIFTIQ